MTLLIPPRFAGALPKRVPRLVGEAQGEMLRSRRLGAVAFLIPPRFAGRHQVACLALWARHRAKCSDHGA
jgi:hypothetical protein